MCPPFFRGHIYAFHSDQRTMPAEVIQLEGSPAELLGGPNATNDDDPAEEPLAETWGKPHTGVSRLPDEPGRFEEDDAASVVTIHEPPRQLSPEEKEERRQLIRKVGRYRALFPAELADIQTTGLDSMPLEALRDLGQDVEFLVGTRRSAKAVRGMFLGSLQGGSSRSISWLATKRFGKCSSS